MSRRRRLDPPPELELDEPDEPDEEDDPDELDVEYFVLEEELDSIETDEDLKPTLYSMSEWNSIEEEDPAFFERVERDRIRLV